MQIMTRAALTLVCFSIVMSAQSAGNLAAMRSDLTGQIDGMKKQAQVMVDTVFSFGELGFQEVETLEVPHRHSGKRRLQDRARRRRIPTAWIAIWGSGKPVISLGSDIDCIPQASQKPGVAYHEPMIEGAPGHGEGHNSGMPLNITAALAVKKVMERENLTGTIQLWPGVAEEQLGTKAYYVRAGFSRTWTSCSSRTSAANLAVSWGDTTQSGLVSVEYTFKGESAHAQARPGAAAARSTRSS